jgi:hypothetical protein
MVKSNSLKQRFYIHLNCLGKIWLFLSGGLTLELSRVRHRHEADP